MATELLTVGTRIFNHGDMANASHFGTVTQVTIDRWGTQYEVTPDADAERKAYWIPSVMVSAEYKGHGGTRIVTEVVYKAWHEERMAAFRRRISAAQAEVR